MFIARKTDFSIKRYGNALVAAPYYPDYTDSFPYRVIRYQSIDLSHKVGYRAGNPFDPKAIDAISKEPVDILHAHCPVTAVMLGRTIRETRNIPMVLTYHTKFDIDIRNAISAKLLQDAAIKTLVGLDNVSGIAYKEEQSGYLAGYAAVMEGYTKLGFCGGGGGTNPACCRYGYGFVQGAEAAADAKGVDVEIKYTWQYGASFSASPELQTMVNGWYEQGTEIVFSAGGSIFNSITAAAAANDKAVIGVDVDQSYESDTVVTSALKGLTASVQWALTKVYDGTWAEISGANSASLGAESDAVGLPTETWSLKNWSVAEYEALLASIKSGSVTIDNTILEADAIASQSFKHVKIMYV